LLFEKGGRRKNKLPPQHLLGGPGPRNIPKKIGHYLKYTEINAKKIPNGSGQ